MEQDIALLRQIHRQQHQVSLNIEKSKVYNKFLSRKTYLNRLSLIIISYPWIRFPILAETIAIAKSSMAKETHQTNKAIFNKSRIIHAS